MRVDFKDHSRPDGTTDWAAYNAAKVANGERCRQCRNYIMYGSRLGVPQLCSMCKAHGTDGGEVDHNSRIRCPACGWNAEAMDSDLGYLYEEGTWDVGCQECGHDFEVSTIAEFTFKSPAMIDKEQP